MDFTRTIVAVGFVVATALAAPVSSLAAATPDQVTDDTTESGCASLSPVPSADGSHAAWQSDCDPNGTNVDGSIEIFRAGAVQNPVQLTAATGCSSTNPTISADGNSIAFESDCNLAGQNSDGNVEIFLWKSGAPAVITQLTKSSNCDNYAPSISGNGSFIAFDSTCNINGTNNSGRGAEIYRVSSTGVLKQLTVDPNGGACDSMSPSIDNNGTVVAFDSDCDLVGDNEDLAIEIYTVNANNLVIRQRTTSGDDSCANLRPSIDGAGSVVAFMSDCNLTGANADRSSEIFTLTVALSPVVQQVTNVDDDSACVSGVPHMASSGLALAFSSYCELNGKNADGSIEVFQVGVGEAAGGILAVTQGSGCSSPAGGITGDGTQVVFDSDCDPAGNNADGSIEIFRASACACGAPVSRKDIPLASDAQYALRAAVGSVLCLLCECDATGNTMVSATDALLILKFAVGQDVELDCPVP